MNFIISCITFRPVQIQINVMLTGCSLGNVVNSGALVWGEGLKKAGVALLTLPTL